jgi:hypothetical protein
MLGAYELAGARVCDDDMVEEVEELASGWE